MDRKLVHITKTHQVAALMRGEFEELEEREQVDLFRHEDTASSIAAIDGVEIHAGRAHVFVAKDGELIRLDPAEALDLAAKLTRWGSNPTNTNTNADEEPAR